MPEEAELTETTITVSKIEKAEWDAPDGKKVPYINISDDKGAIYSVWNPRLFSYFSEGKQVPIRFSKKGKTPRIEQIVGLEQGFKGKGKGGGFRDRDYHTEHIGRLQSSIVVAYQGKWNDECEKHFDSAVQSYFKIINKYSKALPQNQPTEEHKVITPKVEPKGEAEKSPAIPKEPKDFIPNSQGSLIWGAKHYFNKNSQDIAAVLNKVIPASQEKLKVSWGKLIGVWGKENVEMLHG